MKEICPVLLYLASRFEQHSFINFIVLTLEVILYYDNVGDGYPSTNMIQHQLTEYIEIDTGIYSGICRFGIYADLITKWIFSTTFALV